MLDMPFSVRASGMLVMAILVLNWAGAHGIDVHQAPPEAAQAVYARIRDEGLSRSQVMDYATELIDGVGPRLTGSRNLKKAIDWAREQLTQMGLSRVRAESWGEFGVGWEQRNVWVRMVTPDTAVFIAQAAPWSPPTPGPVTADVRSIGGLPNEQASDGGRRRNDALQHGDAGRDAAATATAANNVVNRSLRGTSIRTLTLRT